MAEDTASRTCVVVGGGPAGAMLALLLARGGIDVTLMEKHADFLRDWRGDTIHPSTLEILDELGLFSQFLKLPHSTSETVGVYTDKCDIGLDLRNTRMRYPYVAWVPQWDFLEMITAEARRYPNFRLLMSSPVYDLTWADGHVTGVRYRNPDGTSGELAASLTVAADGRHSTVRELVGFKPRELDAPMDMVGFRISRREGDPKQFFLRISSGLTLVFINRNTYWQVGYLIPKGSYPALKARGIEALHRSVSDVLPFLRDRMPEVSGWDQTITLDVQVNRLPRWHLPGLLLIGDAAHAMSPTGAVGVNLAIQDAVAAANALTEPLRESQHTGQAVSESVLAAIQKRRQLPTAVIQRLQTFLHTAVVRPALGTLDKPVNGPLRLRVVRHIPPLRALAGRIFGVGIRQEHVRVKAYATPACAPEPAQGGFPD